MLYWKFTYSKKPINNVRVGYFDNLKIWDILFYIIISKTILMRGTRK